MARTASSEFGDEYEIPEFFFFLVKKGILQDMSWHNDTSPSFGVEYDNGESDLRVFVEHPWKDERQSGGQLRFLIINNEKGSNDVVLETDDLQQAVERLISEIDRLPGHSGREGQSDDIQDHIIDLAHEFYGV